MVRLAESADWPSESNARTKSVWDPMVLEDHCCDTLKGDWPPLTPLEVEVKSAPSDQSSMRTTPAGAEAVDWIVNDCPA
jgi:hypothetical protein